MTDLASVIKSIESGGNKNALRFEATAYADWPWSTAMEAIRLKHRCSINTARMIACTSWGLYQVMGQNVFDRVLCGIDPADVFAYIEDEAMQDAAFANYLQHKGINWTLDELLADPSKMQTFVTKWNGPGTETNYSSLIRAHAGA